MGLVVGQQCVGGVENEQWSGVGWYYWIFWKRCLYCIDIYIDVVVVMYCDIFWYNVYFIIVDGFGLVVIGNGVIVVIDGCIVYVGLVGLEVYL